jgi:hypothetical protein
MKRVVSVLVAAILSVAVTARVTFAGPCKSAVQELCKGVEKGSAIMACLRSNEAKLTDECRAHLAFFETIPSCVGDADVLCPKNVPSGADVIRCLRGRTSDLSTDCKNDLRKIR